METTSQRPRRGLRLLLGLITALATSVLALVVLAAPASAAASLTASQTTGVASGATLTVSGAGFSASTKLFVAFCDTSVPNGGACDMANFKQVTTDGAGAFSGVQMKVMETFGGTNCATKPCGIQTSDVANPTNAANTATLLIKFAAPASSSAASSAAASSAAPSLPAQVSAGKADTGLQLTGGTVGAILAVLLIGIGVMLLRTRIGRHRA